MGNSAKLVMARARQVEEGATTRAMKTRLLDEPSHYDELAAKADCIVEEAAGF
jgi:hypothetical protein